MKTVKHKTKVKPKPLERTLCEGDIVTGKQIGRAHV